MYNVFIFENKMFPKATHHHIERRACNNPSPIWQIVHVNDVTMQIGRTVLSDDDL